MTKSKENDPYLAEQLDAIFKNLPSEVETVVTLPSMQKVKIRPLTYEDEKVLLTSSRDSNLQAANIVIERCASNVDIDNLLLVDKLYLIMKIREISFGNEYKVTVICSNCKEENKLAIELNKLNVVPLDNKEAEETINLPGIKQEAIVRLPRVKDEVYLLNEYEVLDNLWRFVEAIAGVTDKVVIAAAIKKLPSSDVRTIIKIINGKGAGIQTDVRFLCNSCKQDNLINLPITEDFFSAS